jgi:hypothetical protein
MFEGITTILTKLNTFTFYFGYIFSLLQNKKSGVPALRYLTERDSIIHYFFAKVAHWVYDCECGFSSSPLMLI